MANELPNVRRSAEVYSGDRPSLDYYSILNEAIEQAQYEPARVRALVYERARFNLKREALFGYSNMELADVMHHINELEMAIARIEAMATDGQPSLAFEGRTGLLPDHSAPRQDVILPPKALPPLTEGLFGEHRFAQHLRIIGMDKAFQATLLRLQATSPAITAIVFAGFVLLLGVGSLIYSNYSFRVASEQIAMQEQKARDAQIAAEKAAAAAAVPKPDFPVPTAYGVYAINGDKLVELEAMAMKVPDPRIALSPEITKASTVTISGAKPKFVVFRRDLLNSAPGKVSLRVVAQVMRETKIVGGKATVVKIEGSWRIRGQSVELRVAPVPGNREMIVAQGDENFSLAPGRYVLVLKGLGYDFTVAGEPPSSAHCLEQFQTQNGPIFTECKS